MPEEKNCANCCAKTKKAGGETSADPHTGYNFRRSAAQQIRRAVGTRIWDS